MKRLLKLMLSPFTLMAKAIKGISAYTVRKAKAAKDWAGALSPEAAAFLYMGLLIVGIITFFICLVFAPVATMASLILLAVAALLFLLYLCILEGINNNRRKW